MAAVVAGTGPLADAGEDTAQRSVAVQDRMPNATREFRGVWVATVANIDWPKRPGLPASEQRAELLAVITKASQLHLNAIVLQVRAAADAFYPSALEPWSEFLTGTMGKPPAEPYDPLEFAVREAHRRGIELHAWFNPYRASHPAAEGPVCDRHVSKTHPEWVRKYGKYLWLDPGEPAATDHTMAVILDAVERYDIDGVHLDDYFYPYPIRDKEGKLVAFPDDRSWARAVARHDPATESAPNRDAWRRQNVDRFIERLYREVKARKPWVKVGISPFGIWRPGHPEQIKGFDPYASLYADARKWFRRGDLDYLAPQLYWEIDKPAQSFPVLLKWWCQQNAQQRHLWPGLFTSRLGFAGKRAWRAGEIIAQIRLTERQQGASGNIHFSMKPLLRNTDGIADRLVAGPYRRPALVPACPWLATRQTAVPGLPTLQIREEGGQRTLELALAGSQRAWLWVVRTHHAGKWQLTIWPGLRTQVPLSGAAAESVPTRIAVSAVNRIGQEGPVVVVETP